MSSGEDEFNEGETSSGVFQSLKKRRIQRACDICRRKKSDGVQMPGNRCSNCVAYSFNCTYIEAAKKRGPPKGYVESLENRVERLDKLLRRLCPDEKSYKELMSTLDHWAPDKPPEDPSSIVGFPVNPKKPPPGAPTPLESVTSAIRGVNSTPQTPQEMAHDDDDAGLLLIDNFKRMNLAPTEYRFFGKSSGAMLISKAIELKKEYTGKEPGFLKFSSLKQQRKDEFWTSRPWEHGMDTVPEVEYEFPEPDLAAHVVDLYFEHLAGQFLQGSSAPQSCWTIVGIGIRLAQDVGAHRRKIPGHSMTTQDELWTRAFWVLVCMDRMVSSSLGRPCAIQDEDFDLDLPIDCDDEYWENEDPLQRFKQPPGKPSLVSAFIMYLKLHQILAFSLRTIYSINKSKILLGFVGQQWEQHIVAELDSALNKWVDSVPDHLRWDPNREDERFFNQSVTLYAAYYHIQILIHRPFIPSPSKPSPLSFPSLAICTNAARSCSHVVFIQKKRNPLTIPQIQMSVFTSGVVLLLSIWGGKRSGLSTDPNKEMEDVHKCMEVLRNSEDRWHSAGRLWDILYELASVGDLPLPQHSPSSNNKRERDSDDPIGASDSQQSDSDNSGEPIAFGTDEFIISSLPFGNNNSSSNRNIAGSRRVESSIRSAQALQSEMHQQGFTPSSSPTHQRSLAHRSSQSRMQLQHERSLVSSINQNQVQSRSPVEFALPLYSNELGRIPLHGQVTFSDQVTTHPPLTQQPQQHHTNYWYGDSTGGGNSNSASLLSGNISGSSSTLAMPYRPVGEMSTMTQDFGMDATSMAAGTMFDTMSGALAFSHQAQFGMGSGSSSNTISPAASAQSLRSSIGNDIGTQGALGSMNPHNLLSQHYPQQHTGNVGVAQPDPASYQFVDSDIMAMWSNAPSGFE
ncbi:putative transcriptional regulatory protein [Psilocybe cubensis]|uniref:Transcriptional regulatory protein n=1 Tax=Psilocybe cubensis TaxID=181762 RepID=A0ACB8GZX1_PSICU|nr:putative transcriptional regulatory protein [Psilocybe cubensis]KAH9481126.1 putative transcriptional regulatory protein [Psilocybe cubensis]